MELGTLLGEAPLIRARLANLGGIPSPPSCLVIDQLPRCQDGVRLDHAGNQELICLTYLHQLSLPANLVLVALCFISINLA